MLCDGVRKSFNKVEGKDSTYYAHGIVWLTQEKFYGTHPLFSLFLSFLLLLFFLATPRNFTWTFRSLLMTFAISLVQS